MIMIVIIILIMINVMIMIIIIIVVIMIILMNNDNNNNDTYNDISMVASPPKYLTNCPLPDNSKSVSPLILRCFQASGRTLITVEQLGIILLCVVSFVCH